MSDAQTTADMINVAGWPEGGLAPHPFANIFRLMTPEERAPIGESIRENGIREKIVMYEGKILDGRNRYLEAVRVGHFALDVDWQTHPDFVSFNGLGWDSDRGTDALSFAWDINDNRRHDTTSQRAMSAARYANLRNVSQAEAAEKFAVSERSVSSAAKVVKHGTAELQEAVDAGKVRPHVAERLAELSPEEQREIVAGDRAAVKEKAKARTAKPREAKPRAPEPEDNDPVLFDLYDVAPAKPSEPLSPEAFARFTQAVLDKARAGIGLLPGVVFAIGARHGIADHSGKFTDAARAAFSMLGRAPREQAEERVERPQAVPPSEDWPSDPPTKEEFDEYKALSSVEAGVAVSGPLIEDLRERILIVGAPPVLTLQGRNLLAYLTNKVERASDGDAVRIKPLSIEERDAVIREVYGREGPVDFAEIERRTGLDKDRAKKRAWQLKLTSRDRQRAAVAEANRRRAQPAHEEAGA